MKLTMFCSSSSLTMVPSIHDSYRATRARLGYGLSTIMGMMRLLKIRSLSINSVSSSCNLSLTMASEYMLLVLSYTGFSAKTSGQSSVSFFPYWDSIYSHSSLPLYPTTMMIRFSFSLASCPNRRSIRRTPLTGTIHFVLSLVYSFNLRPIPAANIIACI